MVSGYSINSKLIAIQGKAENLRRMPPKKALMSASELPSLPVAETSALVGFPEEMVVLGLEVIEGYKIVVGSFLILEV